MTCRHPVVTRLPNGSYQCQDCPVVLRPDEVPGTGKTGVTMYHSPVTNEHVIPADFSGDREIRSPCDCNSQGIVDSSPEKPDESTSDPTGTQEEFLASSVANLDDLTLACLLPLWYQIGCSDHHKDRDCHFYIQEDIRTYAEPTFFAEHYGYVCEGWHSPYFGSREDAIAYLEKKLRAMIREVWGPRCQGTPASCECEE